MSDRRFEILEIPGGGAHATVCLARDVTAAEPRPIALKVLRTEFDPGSSEAKRVRDEGVLLEALDHPNIVKLHERLTLSNREILVMEWVEGPPIASVVRKLGRLPVPVAVEILRQVAGAVHYAYHHDLDGTPLALVHRDLNLSNILISVHGDVKILDYGLAKASFEGREADTLVSLQGTAGYVAPEGLHDRPSQDVYALGICFFFMLTGHLPILSRQRLGHANGLAEQLGYMRKELAERGVDADPLDTFIRALCTFDPSERPTIEAVREMLDELPVERVDLAEWAGTHVHPIHAGRLKTPPHQHASWDELEFLQDLSDLPTEERELDTDADAILRRFLSHPNWHERLSELTILLAQNPTWSAKPVLEQLAPLDRPWWNIFRKRPPPQAIRAALKLLSRRPGPDVVARAKRLVHHRDAGVRELARALAEEPDRS